MMQQGRANSSGVFCSVQERGKPLVSKGHQEKQFVLHCNIKRHMIVCASFKSALRGKLFADEWDTVCC